MVLFVALMRVMQDNEHIYELWERQTQSFCKRLYGPLEHVGESEIMSNVSIFSGVRVTRFLVLCVYFVDRCLSFCTFSFGHCVVRSSSTYIFWLPLWYLQTLSRQKKPKHVPTLKLLVISHRLYLRNKKMSSKQFKETWFSFFLNF